MKNQLIILCITICSGFSTMAQIKVTQTAKAIIKEEVVKYDSNTNLVQNGKELLGQELFVIPKREKMKKIGYFNFFKAYKETQEDFSSTDSEELFSGKTFVVEEVLFPYGQKTFDTNRGKRYILKLRDKASDTIYYFKYDPRFEARFPFIILGFYEKQKTACIGKQMVVKKQNWREKINSEEPALYDCKTGQEVVTDIDDVWTVQELSLEDKYLTLSYTITNKKGETLTIDIYSLNDYKHFYGPYALWLDKTLLQIKTNQPGMYQALMSNKVKIGMTEEMVRMAWGEPREIKHSSYNDQWIYRELYLYFKNGILSRFN